MLKIKGLKKKKKGKKSKHKEEELFEAAELEEYRKEQQKKQEELREKGLETQEEDEEWKKFKLLTTGVDDILKKTQGDLDRIKSTSYYQKRSQGQSETHKEKEKVEKPERPRAPTEKKWVGFEEGDSSLTVEVTEDNAEEPVAGQSEQEFRPEVFTEEEEEESEEEDELDDLFDTSYVDAVESGEVVLAYIPESPTQEDDNGYDPFDTSIVDKVISVKDQKKALVTLGSAVEVLSGKVEKPTAKPEPTPFATSKRRRPRPQDLLLGSFDESQPATSPQITVETAPKSILDDDPVFEEQTSETLGFIPVTPVTEVTTPTVAQEPKERKESGVNLKNLVDEFVSPVTPNLDLKDLQLLTEPVNVKDELDDEFAALAAESISKEKSEVTKSKPPPRPAPPAAGSKSENGNDLDNLDDDDNEISEDDPFDTTFADKVLPGKYELKLIEKEVLQDHVQLDTTNIVQNKINEVLKSSDPTVNPPKKKFEETFEEDDFKLLSPSQRDLLGGSTTDLSTIGQHPIQPDTAVNNNSHNYSDPFDTSIIDSIVAPKKTELKYLEQELLEDQKKVHPNDELDDDFDPRAGENPPSRPDSLVVTSGKRASVPKIVAFDVKNDCKPDLLAVDQEESSKVGKPLTPYYTDKNILEEKLTNESEVDPFDTSFVTNVPGKVELKLLENELVGNSVAKEDLTDTDFDPRAEETVAVVVTQPINKSEEGIRPDIISEDVSTDIKLHTPVTPRRIEEDLQEVQDIDPFDTSIVSSLAPGKAEIKILEKELIESGNIPIESSDKSSEVVKNLLEKAKKNSTSSDTDLLAHTHIDDINKPLTPIPADFSIEDEDYDPFDTSAVENILPGKTEIKLLESELLN